MGLNDFKITSEIVETALSSIKAFEKVDDSLFIVKQGSTFVSIRIGEMGDDITVRFIAHMVKGVNPSFEMAMRLLGQNAVLKYGAFAYVPKGDLILFSHTLLGGETLDEEEVATCIEAVANTADQWDNKIIGLYGGDIMENVVDKGDLDGIIQDIEDMVMFEFSEPTRGKIRSFLRTFFL